MQNIRQTTEKDQGYKSSTCYTGNDGFVARLEEAMSWNTAGENIRREKGITEEKPYQGYSEKNTELTRRIANLTFQPENDSQVRTQMVIEQRLKNQIAQAKEDLAREKANIANIKEALNYY